MNLIVLGQVGSDAGYWYLGSDGKWHHVGGWSVETLADVTRAVSILGQAAQLKTPGLADAVGKSLIGLVEKEMGAHLGKQLKEGGVVIVNAAR